MAERAAEGVADEDEEMIESIENLEDMKVVALLLFACLLFCFSFCLLGSERISFDCRATQ